MSLYNSFNILEIRILVVSWRWILGVLCLHCPDSDVVFLIKIDCICHLYLMFSRKILHVNYKNV
jgi:hypothetical protein